MEFCPGQSAIWKKVPENMQISAKTANRKRETSDWPFIFCCFSRLCKPESAVIIPENTVPPVIIIRGHRLDQLIILIENHRFSRNAAANYLGAADILDRADVPGIGYGNRLNQ